MTSDTHPPLPAKVSPALWGAGLLWTASQGTWCLGLSPAGSLWELRSEGIRDCKGETHRAACKAGALFAQVMLSPGSCGPGVHSVPVSQPLGSGSPGVLAFQPTQGQTAPDTQSRAGRLVNRPAGPTEGTVFLRLGTSLPGLHEGLSRTADFSLAFSAPAGSGGQRRARVHWRRESLSPTLTHVAQGLGTVPHRPGWQARSWQEAPNLCFSLFLTFPSKSFFKKSPPVPGLQACTWEVRGSG